MRAGWDGDEVTLWYGTQAAIQHKPQLGFWLVYVPPGNSSAAYAANRDEAMLRAEELLRAKAAKSLNPIKKQALKQGWLNHDLYREADAYVSGYEAAQAALAWQDKMIHDLIIYWLCEGVTGR